MAKRSVVGEVCYLCGHIIKEAGEADEDHVIPKVLIRRSQPKTKGFKYGSVLPTHRQCNNRFGEPRSNAESMCTIALTLIEILYPAPAYDLRADPTISILAVSSEGHEKFLGKLTRRDKGFFGLIYAREAEYEDLKTKDFYGDNPRIVPMKKPVEVSLTVLAKSSAAYLVKWCDVGPSSVWDIIVVPLMGDSHGALDKYWAGKLGVGSLLEERMKLWQQETTNGDRIVVYAYGKVCVFLYFKFSGAGGELQLRRVLRSLEAELRIDVEVYRFTSRQLLDLVGYEWTKHKLARGGRLLP